MLGMGIHNEPGLHEISPMPHVESLISDMLKYCLDTNDSDRSFVEFRPDDVVLLLINNFGGMSNFELEALTGTTRRVLQKEWNIVPQRVYAQCFETSLNAPGWSISLLNVSGIERDSSTPLDTLMHLLDMDTRAPAWPRNGYAEAIEPGRRSDGAADSLVEGMTDKGPRVDPSIFEVALRKACDGAIAAEPDITKWDIQMGDGDCGEAVVSMCQGVLKKLDGGLCKDGDLFHILDEIDEAVEEIGGTLGAIIAIILASFTTSLRKIYAKDERSFTMNEKTVGQAAGQALRNLLGYTSARQGGRTVMDTLIPFCEAFEKSGDFAKAVKAANEGARSTSGMKASFGRGEPIVEEQHKDQWLTVLQQHMLAIAQTCKARLQIQVPWLQPSFFKSCKVDCKVLAEGIWR